MQTMYMDYAETSIYSNSSRPFIVANDYGSFKE